MIKLHRQSGFSLVETLVAISLLLIIIVGPMAISAKTAKSTSFASEQVQAFFLAQEGLELAQKARDDLKLRMFLATSSADHLADPWASFVNTNSTGLYDECFLPAGCGLMWGNASGKLATITVCGAGVNSCRLYQNDLSNAPRSGFSYWTNAGVNPPTPFVRKIYFSTTDSSREIKVRSEVTWRTGSLVADQKVVLDTYLLNTNYETN